MKNMKLVYATLLAIVIVFYSMLSFGAETKRAWMPSACYKFNLSVMDKFNSEAASVKYTVITMDGIVFVAERSATDDPNPSEVVFPDDFHEAKLNVKAWVDCFGSEKYKWAIYINGVLIDSGTIGLTRDKRK